ncbi:hypothetical protein [Methylobacterium sp. J-092]|nr:hypothetical protein [Methylobacterium sp. J-092]
MDQVDAILHEYGHNRASQALARHRVGQSELVLSPIIDVIA